MSSHFKKRTLITGGAGFIGSNYLNYAVKRHPKELFINVDILTYAADKKNIVVGGAPNYLFKKVDICDAKRLETVFKTFTPTGIIHFAAESHVDHSIKSSSIFMQTNVVGTNNLAHLARMYGVERFHFISTDEVYGALGLKDPSFTEKSPPSPRNPYSASKAAAELLLLSYMHTHHLPLVITRGSNTYGPHQDTTKLIPKFISNLLGGKKVPLYATGENIRDWFFVEDAVKAIDLVFRKGRLGEIYNIGGEEELTNLEVTRTLLKHLGKTEKEIEFVTDRLGHDFRYALSIQKIKKNLGWKKATSFSKGIKKTISYYKKKIMR